MGVFDKKDKENEFFELVVQDLDQIIFTGKAKAVTAYNEKGIFDILSMHENFISLINKNVTIQKENGEIQTLEIDKGILRVKKNRVEIFVGIQDEV